MRYRQIRVTSDTTDDELQHGLQLGATDALALSDFKAIGGQQGLYRTSNERALFRAQWLDSSDVPVAGAGTLTIAPVSLDVLFPVDDQEPPILSANNPYAFLAVGNSVVAGGGQMFQLEIPEFGLLSVQLTDMTPPDGADHLCIWGFCVD